MRRDDDFLRSFLIGLESGDASVFVDPHHMNMNEGEHKTHYRIQLATDAGLLTGVGRGTFRTTNAGHDYLAAIKDEGIWRKTKAAVAEQGGSATLGILRELATGFLKKQIADKTGIQF